jgi:adenine deaminase
MPDNAVSLDSKYRKLAELGKESGCRLEKPLLTLSFMALPVIPELKITDKGLFSVDSFSRVKLFC